MACTAEKHTPLIVQLLHLAALHSIDLQTLLVGWQERHPACKTPSGGVLSLNDLLVSTAHCFETRLFCQFAVSASRVPSVL